MPISKPLLRIVLLCLAAGAAHAATPADPADVPIPKNDARFGARHEKYVAIARQGGVDLLLTGDFLPDDFRGHSKNHIGEIFEKAFGRYKPANFGQGGDYTQHVLWRLQNGELDGITPKVVMLMIGGTNGSNGEPPERIFAGVKAIVEAIKTKSPKTKVLLLPVLPWGPPGDRRNRHVSVNQLLPQLDDGGKTVKFVDMAAKFLDADGNIPTDIMPDGAHLNEKGYQIWADAVEQPLRKLMETK